jgi:hypothetical protein
MRTDTNDAMMAGSTGIHANSAQILVCEVSRKRESQREQRSVEAALRKIGWSGEPTAVRVHPPSRKISI